MKIGIIGCSRSGEQTARALAGFCHEVVCATPDEADAFAEMLVEPPLARGAASRSARLDAAVEAVVVATPDVGSRFPLAREALKNGQHVLVPGVAARSAVEARELEDLARMNACALLALPPDRYGEAGRALHRALQGSDPLRLLTLRRGGRIESLDDLGELLAPDVALLLDLVGSAPDWSSAMLLDDGGAVEGCVLVLHWAHGPIAQIELDLTRAEDSVLLTAHAGDEQVVLALGDGEMRLSIDGEPIACPRPTRESESHAALAARFVAGAERPPGPRPVDAGRDVVRVLEALDPARTPEPAA